MSGSLQLLLTILAVVAVILVTAAIIAVIGNMIIGAFDNGKKAEKDRTEDYQVQNTVQNQPAVTNDYDFETINLAKEEKEKAMKDKEVEDFSLEQAFEDDDEEISAIEESLKNNTTTKVEETIEEDEEEDLDDLDSLLEDISNEVVEEEANKEEPVAEPSALDKYNIDTYLNEQEDEEEEVEEAPIQLVEDRSQEIEELKAQLALANQKLEEARNSKVEVVTVNMTEEACLERLAILEERLKTTKADLKINMKEYRPLKKVMDNLERYQTKLRRKENSLANKKVALYGVNKYVDIDKEQAEKVLNESELVDGLRLSVQHCEEVIELNKDRYPILAHTNKILTDNIANLEQDIESTKQMLQTIRDKKDGNNGDNGEDEE